MDRQTESVISIYPYKAFVCEGIIATLLPLIHLEAVGLTRKYGQKDGNNYLYIPLESFCLRRYNSNFTPSLPTIYTHQMNL